MKTIKKIRPTLPLLLVMILLMVVFFWPQGSQPLSVAILTFGVGMAIFLTVRPDWMRYRQGKIAYRQFVRVIAINLIGLLLALVAAILAGRWAGQSASLFVWDAGWPEWSVIVAGILAGFAAGFAAGLLVRFIWGRLFGPKRVKPAQAGGGRIFQGRGS